MATFLQFLRAERIIRDDHGSEHTIPIREWAKGDHPSPRMQFVQREAAAIANSAGMVKISGVQTLVIAMGFTAIVFLSLWAIGVGSGVFQYLSPVSFVVGALGANTIRWFSIRKQSERIVALMAHNGLCGACGYEMVDALIDDGGAKRCAECGAAWRASRFPSASIAGPGEAPKGDPVVHAFVGSFRGQRATREIRDNRGQPTNLLSRPIMDAASSSDLPELAERRRRAHREVRALRRGDRWTALLVAGIWMVALTSLFSAGFPRSASATPVGALMGLVPVLAMGMCGLTWMWMIWTDRHLKPPLDLDQCILAYSLCPSCSSDLASRPVERDGCCVCALCAAHWRLIPNAPLRRVRHGQHLTRGGVLMFGRDDVGKPVVLDRGAWTKSPAWKNETIRRSIRPGALSTPRVLHFIGRGVAATAIAAIAWSVVAMTAFAPVRTGSQGAWIAPLWLGLGGIFLFTVIVQAACPHLVRPAVFMMRAKRCGVCPACGYQILDIPPADDGFTACPECGGKWLMGGPYPRTTSIAR